MNKTEAIRDAYGDILEGSAGGNPTVTGYLLDDDHPTKEDPKQTLEFKNTGSGSSDKWYLDDSAARKDWNWEPEFPFDKMVVEMLEGVSTKLGISYK